MLYNSLIYIFLYIVNFVGKCIYRTQCFCGDQEPKLEKKADSKDCKFKCPGDYRYICGGDWRNTVYKTGHPGISHDF